MKKYQPHPKHIDLDNLELEWAAQEELCREAIERLTDGKARLETEEIRLEILQAEFSIKIRSKPKRFGLKSSTEAAIKAMIILQPEIKKQLWRIIKYKKKVGYLQARVTSIDHKKRAMEGLTHLHGQSYWSAPREAKGSNIMEMRKKRRVRHMEDDDE